MIHIALQNGFLRPVGGMSSSWYYVCMESFSVAYNTVPFGYVKMFSWVQLLQISSGSVLLKGVWTEWRDWRDNYREDVYF